MESTALDWQKEIYLNGFAGLRPKTPLNFTALEAAARQMLTDEAYAYIAGGAGQEATMNNNSRAFEQYAIIPRVLCNVGERDTRVTLFGTTIPAPFLTAPIGVLELVHPEADKAVAKAASACGLPVIFSNQASFSMEECTAVMPQNSPRWFQLYWSKSNDLVSSFVKRAEQCGCTAIVVTLDTTMLGWRTRDLNLGYLPFLEGKGIAQYTSDPVFQQLMDEPGDAPEVKRKVTWKSVRGLIRMVNRYPGDSFFGKLRSGKPLRAVRKFISTYSNPCTTWNDLAFLRSQTTLPILLKGVLHPQDAVLALEHGVDGIIVSNHGGRQVDGALASLEALPSVVKAVNNTIPVLLDSGIRSGADAFKAIALGAKAVCIGRPYVYGLAMAGERGVYEVLRNFMAEFELTMGLCGCRSIAEITSGLLHNQALRNVHR